LALVTGAPSAGAQEQVKIGLFTPLTGASSVVGIDMQRGVQLAIERVNAGYEVPLKDDATRSIGPGLLGSEAQLIVEDDESRAAAAMDAVRKLVNVDAVHVVLGEYSSGRTLPTGQFTNENGIVHISIGANSPMLREVGPYFFNAIGLASLQGPQLISLAQAEVGATTIATLFPNNPYGVGVETSNSAVLAEIKAASERFTDVNVALAEGYIPDPTGMCVTAEMEG
jgi:branched-chain amino acid transport system substrate-binding protein